MSGTVSAQEISGEARQHFIAARKAQDADNLDLAESEYRATVRLAPGFAGAYQNLGLVLYVKRNFKESAQTLAKCVSLDPKLVGANLYLGIDSLKLNHAEKAVAYLRHAVQLDSSNKEAQSWLGTAYWQSGQRWEALEQLRVANQHFTNDPDILFVLGEAYRKAADEETQAVIDRSSGTAYAHQVFGQIYLDQNAIAKAAGHFERALQQDPKAPDIHFELGEAALYGGDVDRAEREYRKQLVTAPDDAAATARLGEISLMQSKVPAALDLLTQAIQLSPLATISALGLPRSFAHASQKLPPTLAERLRQVLPVVEQTSESAAKDLALSIVFPEIGQPDTGTASFTRFEAKIPRQPPATSLQDRAMQDFDRQDFDRAATEIHEWLDTHRQDLPAQFLEARIHRLLSLSILDQLLADHPDSYRSHQLLAQTEQECDDDDKAVAEYRKVEELSPTLPGVHYALGHLLIKDGNLEEATTQLQDELKLAPDQPEANAEMGMALLSQNQASAAVGYLTKALALQPDLWTAHEQLGKAYLLEKNYEGARRELKLALKHDPEGVAHYQLGLVYKALGESADAKREFDSSRRIKSDRLAQAKIEPPKPDASGNHE